MKMEAWINLLVVFLVVMLTTTTKQYHDKNVTQDRELIIYSYDSKIFNEIAQIFIDSISQRFDCDGLDLASISIKDSSDFTQIELAPLGGEIYSIHKNRHFEDSLQIGLKLKGSETIYFVLNRYVDQLKSYGNMEFLYRTDVWNFVSKHQNKCIYDDYSGIIYWVTFDYYWSRGINSKESVFYGAKKD